MKTVDRILGEAMTPWQSKIYKNPSRACAWARCWGKRFPEAEPYIAKDAHSAYLYARDIVKKRWPEAEPTIAQDPRSAYYYAKDVIGGRWPEAEPIIAMDKGWWSFHYAAEVIKGRWPEAESFIANSMWKNDYIKEFPDAKDDWILNGWIDWLDT